VHIFSRAHIECRELPELNARIWGAGFTDSHCGPLLTDFEAEKEQGITDIMCIHGEVGAKGSVYNPISEDEIARSGMDYIALGHIHKASGLMRSGDTYYAWPGCPEGRGFDETGDRFVYIAEVGEGTCSIKPEKIFSRRYEIFTTKKTEAEEISVELPPDTQNDIYRIVLSGETDLAPDLEALRRALEGKFFALQLRDMTRLRRGVWEGAGDDTLRGIFLRLMREKLSAAETDDERELAEQAARWGLAALDNREEIVRHENK
jgi:DNA repair exonuclease SbcCD nuclease subunit